VVLSGIGDGTTHAVGTSGGGLVAFLGIGAGVAGVAMSNTVSMELAVASGVRSLLPVGVIAAAPPSTASLRLGRKVVMEGFDLVGVGSV
jgi:hypothetical protein